MAVSDTFDSSGFTYGFVYRGIEAGNGGGSVVTDEYAGLLTAAFADPPNFDLLRQAEIYDDAGFCSQCSVAYCSEHWSPSSIGYGHCPQGHGKSLDPLWSADW
jgi:hypothetical protein